MNRRTKLLALPIVLALALGLAACGDDDDSADTTTTTAKETTTTASESNAELIRWDKTVQEELAKVGCYSGSVDGIFGPETDAAVLAFQKASGLEADGELGPETSSALEKAAAAGEKVCGTSSSTTTTKPGSTTTTTTAGGGSAPCTATALLGGLPAEGEQITSFVCSDGWAGGTVSGGDKFILQSEDGKWYAPSQTPCGTASAGITPEVLEAGC